MKKQNIFKNIPVKLDEESFEDILNTDTFNIQRIISKGHTSPKTGWYDQDDNEWVIVLKGGAVLSYGNGDEVHLESGDYINIPAHTKHKVSWSDPNIETIWIAVHY